MDDPKNYWTTKNGKPKRKPIGLTQLTCIDISSKPIDELTKVSKTDSGKKKNGK